MRDLEPRPARAPRWLPGLVVLVVAAAMAIVLLGRGSSPPPVQLGSLAAVREQVAGGPVRLAELPHLVVALAATPEPVYDQRWGEQTGSILLTPFEQLVVLEAVDPEDGAPLTWCRAAGAFAHPDRERWYGPDGRLLRGDGRRGMDRRALRVVGGGAVEVDDGTWVRGLPVRAIDTSWEPRGSCD